MIAGSINVGHSGIDVDITFIPLSQGYYISDDRASIKDRIANYKFTVYQGVATRLRGLLSPARARKSVWTAFTRCQIC
jgi:hypothetical protein